MHYLTPALAAACCLSAVPIALAQLAPKPPGAPAPQTAPPAQPLDEKEIAKTLARLEELTKSLDESKFGHNAKIIKELREAGMSSDKSFALWLDCKKDVDFDQLGKSLTEFADWKRRQTKDPNKERDAEFQMQVQWLSIVLMDANAKNDAARGDAVAAASQFLDALVERLRRAEGRIQGAANENVLTSVFARHYKLDASVTPKEGAAYVPGNVDAIYEGMIFPYYRSCNQPASLMNAWKKRIEQQTAIAAAFPFKEAQEKFRDEKLPELLWGQARELFGLGQETSAAQTMLSLIQTHMGHKKASEWLAEFSALLKKEEYIPPKPPAKENGSGGNGNGREFPRPGPGETGPDNRPDRPGKDDRRPYRRL